MTQTELNNAVARATGESVSEISRLGFQIGMLEVDDFDASEFEVEDGRDLEDRFVDWDDLELHRNLAFFAQREPELVG